MKSNLITLLAAAFLFCGLQVSAQQTPLWLRYTAISPDESTIAFCYGGDIYTVPVQGGEARILTISDAYECQPVWSPDGKMIAFSSNRYGNHDVFVIPATGGQPVRLTWYSNQDYPSDFTPDGKNIIFAASRVDDAQNMQFPSGALPELYTVPVAGGQDKLMITTPMLWAKFSANGDKMVYQDQKGYEDDYRKHHTSSVTRDIWIYDKNSGQHQKISAFAGEDLNPVFAPGDQSVFYLSEMSGTINVVKQNLSNNAVTQITSFKDHPVRHLSVGKKGMLCYSWNGEIYTSQEGSDPKKVNVIMSNEGHRDLAHAVPVNGISEADVSPNGKEIAFIHRGEVFVASVAEGTTKRITNTPEQERNVMFSPDGKSLVYAGERNGSWNIYTATIERKTEEYFFLSTLVKEEAILSGPEETFQPAWSPDGKEIAFLEERTALKVINLATKTVREIMPANSNYSYSDGDQHYSWSPDGKWFFVSYLTVNQWTTQNGLISSDGKGKVVNLSESGYGAYGVEWMMDGKMMMWVSSRDGMKNHASWGGQMDVYGALLTREAWDEFVMNEEEFTLYSEAKKKKEEEEKAKKDEGKKSEKDKKKGDDDKSKPEIKPIKIELEGLKERSRKLTIHSSDLGGSWISKDGSKLYYLAQFEKGYDLWQTNLRTKETKILAKLGAQGGGLIADKEGKNLFVITGSGLTKIDLEKGEPKPLALKGEMILDESAERAYLFEHIWRQVVKKFYVKDLHQVKWDFYKTEYAKFLPHLTNNFDFADAMGEMLGELNASHTGAFYNHHDEMGDATAKLGIFEDLSYTGKGIRIAEVMKNSPLLRNGSKIQKGIVIEKIDGLEITPSVNYHQFLNRKAGQNTLLSLHNPITNERWEETIKPISIGQENQLRYVRWVENCRAMVDSLSGGKLGYVHVRGMDDQSFRVVFDEVLGKYHERDGLVVDTRFNGGGWLHDDLATFLSGTEYITFMPRGQNLGSEPQTKWTKPSVVLMDESNYSDAHFFPFTYRALKIGKLIGMPVPGTATAVWWEGLQNGVVFGIPEVGMVDKDGKYLENQQLEPDFKVANDPAVVAKGRDQQLEKAIEVLLKK